VGRRVTHRWKDDTRARRDAITAALARRTVRYGATVPNVEVDMVRSARGSRSAGPPVPFRYGDAETLMEQPEVVEINGARLVAGVELDGPLWRDAT
jgi:hypothetical protein